MAGAVVSGSVASAPAQAASASAQGRRKGNPQTKCCGKTNDNNNNNGSGAPGGRVKNEISNYQLPRLRGEEKVTHKQSVVGTNGDCCNHCPGIP